MTYRGPLRLLLLAFALALGTSACGDDETSGHGSQGGTHQGGSGQAGSSQAAGAGGDTGGCQALELGHGQLFFNIFGELTGLRYPVQAQLGDAQLPDYLLIELFDSTTESGSGFLPALASGDFDLARAPDDRITTCQRCVSLMTDVTEGTDPEQPPVFQAAGTYYARVGQMQLKEVHDPLNAAPENSALLGSVSNVELAEVDQTDPLAPFVEGGGCFRIAAASFDTRPTPGAECQDLDDCGNELLEVCDPATSRCVDEFQCGLDQPCESEAFCIPQSARSPRGACYPRCTPFASASCPEGQACVQYGVSEHDGYCLKTGAAELGSSCQVKDAVTGCSSDAVCLGTTCAAQCAFFSGATDCPAGALCDVLGHCRAPSDGDPAKLGEACQDGAAQAGPCAQSGSRFDGICFGYDGAPIICGKSCFVDANDYDGDADDGSDDSDCPAEDFCALRFSSGLGICLPDPICGDGEHGEVAEACDDGNSQSGDGCSADCQTVEYGPLCAAASDLPTNGGSVQGTTHGGKDGFQGSCQQGAARAVVYTISPPGPGQLELRLTSAKNQVFSVRADCATADTELGCGSSSASGTDASLVVQLTQAAAAPLTVLVNAATVLEEGEFSLTADFTPQVCGDGHKVGGEVCDDGNTSGGDGCSADCSDVEYDFWCDNAETLPLNVKLKGAIGGQSSLFSTSCGFGDAPDTLYRFTAPKAGTLTVSLDQTVGDSDFTDLALYALDSCGAPDSVTELGCSSVVYPAEELTLSVTQGQTLFIAVDGLTNTTGKYELSARLD